MSSRRRLLMPVAAILFGLTACTSTPAAAPPAAAPASATPSPAVSTPAAPTSGAPTSAAPTTGGPARTTSGGTAAGSDCPSARTLDRLADLPKGWHFVPSSVQCWKNWAWADPEGPNPGDGFSLFRYTKSTGWRYHSSGSGYHCKEIGINEAAPFCQYP